MTETRGAGRLVLFDYAYDDVDRLIQAQLPTAYGLPAQEDFAYDDAGNRDGPNYAHNANNQIQSSPNTTWTFDPDGNVATRTVGGVEERFTFDRSNRLRAWEQGPAGSPTATASYRYDPFGRRLEKTADGTTTWFLWDGDQLLAEFDASGARTRRYTYAGGFAPLQVIDPAGGGGEAVYEVHTDHLDTPRLLTDAAGEVVWEAGYQAYGEAAIDEDLDGDGTDLAFHMRFPGQYRDTETGLHYNRWRYFDPSSGRYVSSDPLGQWDHANVYQYALQNPIRVVDPRGEALHILLNPVVLTGIAIGLGYAGAACNATNCGEVAADALGAAADALAAAGQMCLAAVRGDGDGSAEEEGGAKERTPETNPEDFEPVRGSPAKKKKETGEVWEKDRLHKDHYEVYKNKKQWEKGRRNRSVWDDGRPKGKF